MQNEHAHPDATEIYESLEGEIRLDVEGIRYNLEQGDLLIVHPGVLHLVQPSKTPFLGRVILICSSEDEK